MAGLSTQSVRPSTPQTQARHCPCCGSERAEGLTKYSPTPWEITRCTDCNFTYLRNPVDYQMLEENLAWEKTYVAKSKAGGSTRLSGRIRKLRAKTIGIHRDKSASYRKWFKDGHVLDVGCGSGIRLAAPLTPYGIEISTALHAQADDHMRARGGYCLKGPGAEVIWEFDAEKFDGIVMFSYLEHETDVMKVLRGAHRALKRDGAIFVRVPNFGSLNRRVIGAKWCGFRYPDHVNYFTLPTLRAIAARVGFEVALVNRLTLPVDDNISVVLRKSAA